MRNLSGVSLCMRVSVCACVLAEMFYSMGPAGMTSSVTSVRSGSELSDSDMESSTHSLASFTQPAALSAQVHCVCMCVYLVGDQKWSICCCMAEKNVRKWKFFFNFIS